MQKNKIKTANLSIKQSGLKTQNWNNKRKENNNCYMLKKQFWGNILTFIKRKKSLSLKSLNKYFFLLFLGSLVGQLLAQDKDQEGTLNSQLTYKIVSLSPSAASNTFSIDEASGRIQALRLLRRNEQKFYHLTVEVSDTGNQSEANHTYMFSPFNLQTHTLMANCSQILALIASWSSRSSTSTTSCRSLRRAT